MASELRKAWQRVKDHAEKVFGVPWAKETFTSDFGPALDKLEADFDKKDKIVAQMAQLCVEVTDLGEKIEIANRAVALISDMYVKSANDRAKAVKKVIPKKDLSDDIQKWTDDTYKKVNPGDQYIRDVLYKSISIPLG